MRKKKRETDIEADRETIIDAVGRIPDRDQIFPRGHKQVPSEGPEAFRASWSGDAEERIKGERDIPVDKELAIVARMTSTTGGDQSFADTTGIRAGDPAPAEHASALEYEDFTEEELRRCAKALNIPGYSEMSRLTLILAIKSALYAA